MNTSEFLAPETTVDVRDMIVVHTALLREFRLAPAAVVRVAAGDRKQAGIINAHLDLLCDMLHHHHGAEDELLWSVLRERVPAAALTHFDTARRQHAVIDRALERANAARQSWAERIDPGSRDALAEALQELHAKLAEHLDDEERNLLPLAAAYITGPEWGAVGAAGAASVPKSKMPLVFGMFAYEGDPEVIAAMLSHAPAVPRFIVPRIAPGIYARCAARIHGTRRP